METKYLTVSALNRYLRVKLENDVHLNRIFITGELSNVKYHYSGHCYFTLKDDYSRINAVMFQTQLKKVLFKLEDGMKVLAVCRLSIYEPQGTYQLYVDKIDVDGLGNLYMAYEKRRLLLEKEGLFSKLHKKPIPSYASDIAIITASSGAAIHDIVQTIQLKCPSAKLTLYPSLVQGEYAAAMLSRRLLEADKNNHDVIIIGRGGGSLEDLWAFNDEHLARAIYHAKTPIISGVGHESDVTICDFVADYRAPTPTGAAQKACFDQDLLVKTLKDYQNKMQSGLINQLNKKYKELENYKAMPVFKYPERIYQNALLQNADLSQRLIKGVNQQLTNHKHHSIQLKQQLLAKSQLLCYGQGQMLVYTNNQLNTLMQHVLKTKKQMLLSSIQQLQAYSPLNVLERGYALVLQENEVMTNKSMINTQKPITIRFKDGEVQAYIKGDD